MILLKTKVKIIYQLAHLHLCDKSFKGDVFVKRVYLYNLADFQKVVEIYNFTPSLQVPSSTGSPWCFFLLL